MDDRYIATVETAGIYGSADDWQHVKFQFHDLRGNIPHDTPAVCG